MKKTIRIFALIVIGLSIIFTSCQKESIDKSMEDEIANDEANIYLKSVHYETSIVKPLVKPDDCAFYTEGTIEYSLGGKIVAIVDFGDGEKDNWATKTIKGVTSEFDLKRKKDKSKYTKRIIKPLVKTTNCNYIVEGTIEYLENGIIVAIIDYGNGVCDEWATKTWNGGSKVFSLKDWKKKKI